MKNAEFSELCAGVSQMLTELSGQANVADADADLEFNKKSAPATIEPLAQIIAAIAKAAS